MDQGTLVILLLSGVLYFLWRSQELRPMQALMGGLIGFYLAESALASGIRHGVTAVLGWVSTWHT